MHNLIICLSLVICFLCTGCQDTSPKPKTARVMAYQDFTSFIGKIEPSERLMINTPINGIIEHIHVQPGELVKKGQLIASIQSDSAEETLLKNLARSAIVKSQADRLARKVKAYQELYDEGIISQNEFDSLKNSKTASEYELIEIKQTLAHICPLVRHNLCQANTQTIAQSLPIYLDFKAPKDGQIIAVSNIKHYRKGTTLKAHEALFALVNTETITVTITVNDNELHLFPLGETVNIDLGPHHPSITGQVQSYQPKPTKHSSQPQFSISIISAPLQANTRQSIQMGASATVIPGEKHQLLLIPTNSLLSDKQGNYVTRVQGNDQNRIAIETQGQVGQYWIATGSILPNQRVQVYD